MSIQIVSLQHIVDVINSAHTDKKMKNFLKTASLVSIRDPKCKINAKNAFKIPPSLLKSTSYKFIDDNATLFKDVISATFDDVNANYVFQAKAPKITDVKRILEWAKDKDKDEIIVHCTAGISRSSAIAYLIEYNRTKSIGSALGVLDKTKHNPNKLIICHGASILNNSLLMLKLIDSDYKERINKLF